ncbi:uncharacterized protein SCHCODRAFT_01341880 [Schizophyllum commune H4-8]|nr:uncharacterized protein SCHCODRAFT_01341880 [Schizophyllum commune H4-8]KAI5886465.1 hypothetical protein SCHCODRAFT_01341880 [Schizophyllum commune H4-8]
MDEIMIPPDSQKSKIPCPALSPWETAEICAFWLSDSQRPAEFTQPTQTAIVKRPATFLGKRRAHRRTPQPSRRDFAAPRAAAIGASASVHEARDPLQPPRKSVTAGAGELCRRG